MMRNTCSAVLIRVPRRGSNSLASEHFTATVRTNTGGIANDDLQLFGADDAAADDPPSATDASLSLERLEGIALGNHPALAEAMAQVRAERGRWVQAGLNPNPHIGFSGQQLGSGGEAEQIGLYVGQLWVRGDKLSLDQAVVARKIRVAEQNVNRTRLAVQSQIRRAYYTLAIAHRRLILTQSLVDIATQNVRLTEILFENKEIGQVDVLREKMQLEMVATEFQNSKAELASAIVQLQAVVGVPLAELEDEDNLARISASLPDVDTLSVDIDQQAWSESHPDLAVAAFEIEAARWRIERARAENVSDLDVQMVVQYDESTDSGNSVLQVTGPLRLWNKNQGTIQAAYAELVAATQGFEKIELALDQKFARAFAEFEKAKERVIRYSQEGGILEMSRSTVTLLEKGVELGELNRLSLFLAQRERMQNELRFLDALGQMLEKKAQLETLLVDDASMVGAGGAERPAERRVPEITTTF